MPAVIKKIDKKSWRTLREEAVKHGVTTGRMVEIMVKEHVENEKKKDNAWDMIFERKKPVITAKEAEIIKKRAKEFRNSFKMRI